MDRPPIINAEVLPTDRPESFQVAVQRAAELLRVGEVVPVLESSGEWVRVEDNAGARGWAHVADARRLDVPPEPPRD